MALIYCKDCTYRHKHYDIDSGEARDRCFSLNEKKAVIARIFKNKSNVIHDPVLGYYTTKISFVPYKTEWILLSQCRDKNKNFDCPDYKETFTTLRKASRWFNTQLLSKVGLTSF